MGARVATAAILIAGLLAALLWLPTPLFAALVALLVAGAGHEWSRLCGLRGASRAAYALAAAAGFVALYASSGTLQQGAFAMAALFWLLAAPAWLAAGLQQAPRAAVAAAGFAVLVPAALALAALAPGRLLAVLGLVWVADSAAYFAGRRWGRRRLAPSISPGKTWEGAAAGIAAALVYAIICRRLFDDAAWAPYLAAAALLAVISIVGDLFESAVKRRAGVKDSGALLPGHGGILDRIDSATAVLPLAALLLTLMKGNA